MCEGGGGGEGVGRRRGSLHASIIQISRGHLCRTLGGTYIGDLRRTLWGTYVGSWGHLHRRLT